MLVVEDDHDTSELVALFLSEHGADVRSAASAEEALDAVRVDTPELMISDIGTPDRDGDWLIEQVHALRPTLPALALTAYARDSDVQQALAAGVVRHVSKPVDPLRLTELVLRHRSKRC